MADAFFFLSLFMIWLSGCYLDCGKNGGQSTLLHRRRHGGQVPPHAATHTGTQ